MKPKMQSDIRNIKGDRGRWLAALKSDLCGLVKYTVRGQRDRWNDRRDKGIDLTEKNWVLVSGDGPDIEFVWEFDMITLRLDGVMPDNTLRIQAILNSLLIECKSVYGELPEVLRSRWRPYHSHERINKWSRLWLFRQANEMQVYKVAEKRLRTTAFLWQTARANPLVIDEENTVPLKVAV